MSFAPLWGRDRETPRCGWSRDDRNRTYGLHSGSRIVCFACATASETSRTKWDRLDTQWFCLVAG